MLNAATTMILIAVGASLIAIVESLYHRRLLAQIPIRIHVNGTRGKSSVTRLIAAGLRAGEIRTCAKTTGTLARMIFCDGRELPIFRPGANVIEQKRVIRAAVKDKAEAIVIECMALQPELQSVCELKLVRSTHGVITNAREDHLDVMGPRRMDVAKALAGTTPVGGRLFTSERRFDSLKVFADAAIDRGASLEVVGEIDVDRVTQAEMAGFLYLEHRENVAVALQVCESVGVDRSTALRGMWSATPDPGAMQVNRRVINRQPVYFVNAFAANDPESTTQIWSSTFGQFPDVSDRVVVMNCRVDRPDRSRAMAEVCAGWENVGKFLVTGTGTDIFLRGLLSRKIDADRILCLGSAEPHEIFETFRGSMRGGAMMLGIGNASGLGMALANFVASDFNWPQTTIEFFPTTPLAEAI